MRLPPRSLIGVLPCVVVLACSASESEPAASADAGVDVTIAPPRDASAEAKVEDAPHDAELNGCADDLVKDAPEIAPTLSNDPKPEPQGGAILQGRYHVTAIIIHAATSKLPAKLRSTFRFGATDFASRDFWVEEDRANSTKGTYTANDGGFSLTKVCGSIDKYSSYTANGDTVTLLCDGLCPLELTLKKVD